MKKRKNYFPKKSYSFEMQSGRVCTLEISCGLNKTYFNLILSKRDIESSDTSNFIELISIRAGSLEKHVRSTEYSVLEEALARSSGRLPRGVHPEPLG